MKYLIIYNQIHLILQGRTNEKTDLKSRLIVTDPFNETHTRSNFIGVILKPLTKYVNNYTRDTP